MLKCFHCTYPRSIFHISVLRTFRTSTSSFYSDKDEIRDRYVPPKKRTLFKALKDHRAQSMMIDDVPEKESVGTMLKVQRVSHDIPKDFKTVYKFPPVKYFALINRLKVYQTIVAAIVPISSITLYACGAITSDYVFISTGLGLAGCLMLYSLGYAAAQFVGFIYYNEKTQIVRIAYVDFWGRRRDIEVPASDIVPRSESPGGLIKKLWYPLRRYSTNETLKLQLDQGIIMNHKLLDKIL